MELPEIRPEDRTPLVEALLANDPAVAKPGAPRQAVELIEMADAAAADSARLVRATIILSRGFATRGQPLVAARWLWRAVRCRRTGFVDLSALAFHWARRRLARLGRAPHLA